MINQKKYIEDELNKYTLIRFNQKLESYLKVSVGNDISIALPNMIQYKQQIQQNLNILAVVDIYYNKRLWNVTIKINMVIYKKIMKSIKTSLLQQIEVVYSHHPYGR